MVERRRPADRAARALALPARRPRRPRGLARPDLALLHAPADRRRTARRGAVRPQPGRLVRTPPARPRGRRGASLPAREARGGTARRVPRGSPPPPRGAGRGDLAPAL